MTKMNAKKENNALNHFSDIFSVRFQNKLSCEVFPFWPTAVVQRVGARLQCETSRVRILVRAWMLCLSGVGFSVSSLFLVTAVWNRQGKLRKKVSNKYVLEQKGLVLNWLTVTKTKSKRRFELSFLFLSILHGIRGFSLINTELFDPSFKVLPEKTPALVANKKLYIKNMT